VARTTGRGSSFLFGVRREALAEVRRETPVAHGAADGFHALGNLLRRESFAGFLTTLLRYGDRNSMAHSREVRLPFCDHRLPELVLSLPPDHLMGGIQTKRLMREGLAPYIPEAIRTRWNKQGFLPPQAHWLSGGGALLPVARDLLESRSFREDPIFDWKWWGPVVQRAAAGDKDAGQQLWRPFIYQAWRETFLARVAAPGAPAVAPS
jgi:asparagine synthase (glutamine-hydrolysing)